jgi:hypothetical protein
MGFDAFRCFEKSDGSRGTLAYAAVLPKKSVFGYPSGMKNERIWQKAAPIVHL